MCFSFSLWHVACMTCLGVAYDVRSLKFLHCGHAPWSSLHVAQADLSDTE